MNKNLARQYTIRNVPEYVDQILRQRAKVTQKSFNQVALEALIFGAGKTPPKRDLSAIVGSMREDEATMIEEEIQRQRQVDAELWT